ncbi:MAG: hypothetical protein V4714_08205 [Bacteroidota bacterium]
MSPYQSEILTQLEQASTDALDSLLAALPDACQQIADEVRDFIAGLDKSKAGRINPTGINLKRVDAFRKTLDKIVASKQYGQAIEGFLAEFGRASKLIDLYFGTVVSSFNPAKAAYAAIRQSNIETTVTSLLGSGVDANFKDPIVKLLKQNIAGNSDSRALQELMRNEILGTPTTSPVLTRYVKQVSNDSLYQYESNYLQAVSNDLELAHYFYQGTVIGDSRDFCAQRTGKYYTDEQVKSWGNLHWAGQIKGTNSSNILTNRGGHFCKHLIIPVSKALYDLQAKKGKAG